MPLLLAALFALGTHSTVFGPIKYALLPQHLRDDELVAGNALIEAGTFLSILLGTIIGGSVVLIDRRRRPSSAASASCAPAIGWLAARLIPPAPPAAGADRAAAAALRRLARGRDAHVRAGRRCSLPVLAISWFWLFGATIVAVLPVLRQGRPLRRRATS